MTPEQEERLIAALEKIVDKLDFDFHGFVIAIVVVILVHGCITS